MGFKKYDGSTWQPITPKKLKGIPYTGTLPAVLTGTKAGYLHKYKIFGNLSQNGTPTPENPIYPSGCGEIETTGIHAGQYKLPILSNSTVTNIYLGETQTTRRIKKLVLTGTESWSYYSSNAPFRLNLTEEIRSPLSTTVFWVCSHYEAVSNSASWASYDSCISWSTADGRSGLRFRDIRYSNLADFKAYIAQQYANGTPVTVWYVLAEPETAVVNEPLMKIGDYADTIDSTQTSAQIPTSANSTTISWAGEGLAPSEFDSIQEWVDIPTYTRVNGKWIANVETIVYGIHVDPDEGDPSARVTYLEDAVGMTPAYMGDTSFNYGSWQNAFFMPKPCVLNYDGTVAYYLDPNDYSKKLDGTASNVDDLSIGGNVMLEFPKIWFKFVANASGNDGDFYVANKKVDDSYECWCNYDADNNEIDHFYMAAYNGCCYDGKMRSISGLTLAPWVATAYSDSATYVVGDKVNYNNCMYKCITAVETAEVFDPAKWEQYAYNGNTDGTQEIARARANNTTAKDEWTIDLWADANLIWGLLYLIGKSTNVQATFGRGIDSGSQAAAEAYVTGTLDDKGLFYGDTVNGSTAVKVFGIENFWACKWRRCAGLIGTSTGISYKLTHGTKDGSSATAFNTNGSGYLTLAYTQPSSNYVKNMNYGKWGILAKVTGSPAASNKYYCDYFYAGTGFALFGGTSSYGAYCGVCVGLHYSVGRRGWNVAAAPSCKPLKVVSSNEE